ncbi:MAG TPA: polyprenyl synthetase family protein [Chloroflexota bacterium]|nr:polyprenyl synthetase family protein [Chloroflexota bacterium]
MGAELLITRQQAPPAAASATQVLERFRQPIEAVLRRVLAERSGPMYDMLGYHLGFDGAGPAQGKAFRPTLCLLVCEALGGPWQKALPAAASIELIHNFSLIHDDIQDGDRLRRGRPTLWTQWGVPQAINAGDAMFCLATLTLAELRPQFEDELVVEVMSVLQEATREMIEGQYLDVRYEAVPQVGLTEYLEMIRCKTGALLRASIEIGAQLAGAGPPFRLRCRRFGEAIGRLFQIRDDMLGVWGESEATGKPVGSDIKRKKKSLPIVMALSLAGQAEREALLSMYGQEMISDADVDRIQQTFERLDVKARVQALADEAHSQAMDLAAAIHFSDQGRAELVSLVNFLLERDH